jgi:glycosyltransferase involved in cell wall biosynthesis
MARSILHLIDSLDPAAGGPVEIVRALAREHAAMGHRVCAGLLTRWEGPAPEGLEIVNNGEKAAFGGYGFRAGFVAWLREEARRHDAIFIHGLWQYHGAAAWLALAPRETPYFVFPHGMLDPWFAGDRARHLKKRLYWDAVESRVLRKARAVLFTSEAERERARGTFGAPWRAEELVPLGIAEPPPDEASQREMFLRRFPELRERRIVLFLGRVDRKKGCDLLVRAFVAMRPEGWALVIAGPCADAAYRAELEALAAGAPVHFTGMLRDAEKWGAFRCADVFALPSHQENFGIAIAEALACGVPALLSSAVDTHETVVRAGAGFVDMDNLAGTRRLLEKWIALPAEERERMKTSARHCFRTQFAIRQTATRILSLLESPPNATP